MSIELIKEMVDDFSMEYFYMIIVRKVLRFWQNFDIKGHYHGVL